MAKHYGALRWKKQVKAMGAKGKLGAGGRFHAIAEKGAEQYGSEERGRKVAAAIMWKKHGKKGGAKLIAKGKRGK